MSIELMNIDGIESRPLHVFTEKAYLDYSMSVILDRALPQLSDGLKPVQRRIIYAMSELGLKAGSKFKKSARTVGDVLGKFHPHGDSACYEAMVLMAQDFSFRYRFVEGQGNWGSPDDPKSFAAMRYTESRLSAYANNLLTELGQGTVDWLPNFDATLEEPAFLPARLPNILLNGGSGIAVGMATDIPPHNLNEVVAALIHLLDNPKATLNEMLQFIKGPDYPTGAEIITPTHELHALYEKGNGSIRMRAIYTAEDGDLVITALPYQTSGAKVLEQIAAQMQAKKLPMVADLRDESDHETPIRLVIVPRSNRVDMDSLMSHLFSTTDLEKTYRVNLNMIGLDGKPRVKNLLTILNEWLHFRLSTVTKRLQYRLEKVLARLHILDGLLVAFLNIDEVIQIIRESDDPKLSLQERFKLSELQANAILEIKLRHLAKLEEIKIRAEQKDLSDEREQLEKILGSKQRLKTLVKKELLEDKDSFGDDRRCPLVERSEAKAIKAEALIPSEAITIVLSTKGWVRAAKGHDVDATQLNYKAGDEYLMASAGKSNQQACFIDSTGRSYSLPAHSLPSARGQGEPLTGRLTPPSGASFIGTLIGADTQHCLLTSDAGYGFICTLADLQCKNRNGKTLIKPSTNAQILPPQLMNDISSDRIAMVSNEGRLLIFPAKELPCLARGKGNKMLSIPSKRASAREELVAAYCVLPANSKLVLYAGKRHLTLKGNDLAHYESERARRGNKLPRGYQRIDRLTFEA